MNNGVHSGEAILWVAEISAPWRETSKHCCFLLSFHPITPLCFHLCSFTHTSIHLFIWLAIHPCVQLSILSHTHTHSVMLMLKLTCSQPAISLREDVLLLWQTLCNRSGFHKICYFATPEYYSPIWIKIIVLNQQLLLMFLPRHLFHLPLGSFNIFFYACNVYFSNQCCIYQTRVYEK